MRIGQLVQRFDSYVAKYEDWKEAARQSLNLLAETGHDPFADSGSRLDPIDLSEHLRKQQNCLTSLQECTLNAMKTLDETEDVDVFVCGPAAKLEYSHGQSELSILAVMRQADQGEQGINGEDGEQPSADPLAWIMAESDRLQRIEGAIMQEIRASCQSQFNGEEPAIVCVSGMLLEKTKEGKSRFIDVEPRFHSGYGLYESSFPAFEKAHLIFDSVHLSRPPDATGVPVEDPTDVLVEDLADADYCVSRDIEAAKFPSAGCALITFKAQSGMLALSKDVREGGNAVPDAYIGRYVTETWSSVINLLTMHLLFLRQRVARVNANRPRPLTKERIGEILRMPPIEKAMTVIPEAAEEIHEERELLFSQLRSEAKQSRAETLLKYINDSTGSFDGWHFPLCYRYLQVLGANDLNSEQDQFSIPELLEYVAINAELFRLNGWTQELAKLVVTSPTPPDGCRQKFESLLAGELFSRIGAPTESKAVDVAILFALDEERNVVADMIPHGEKVWDGKDCLFKWGKRDKAKYSCVLTCISAKGPIDAALETERLLGRRRPRLLVSLGIAGGIKTELKLGDVVAGVSVGRYLEGAKVVDKKGGRFDFKWAVGDSHCTHAMVDATRRFKSHGTYKDWCRSGANDLRNKVLDKEKRRRLIEEGSLAKEPKLEVERIASGPVVASSEEWVKEVILDANKEYWAVDMESGGVLQAVDTGSVDVQTMVLRGISDFADKRKIEFDELGDDKTLRQYATRNAFRLLCALMDAHELPRWGSPDV